MADIHALDRPTVSSPLSLSDLRAMVVDASDNDTTEMGRLARMLVEREKLQNEQARRESGEGEVRPNFIAAENVEAADRAVSEASSPTLSQAPAREGDGIANSDSRMPLSEAATGGQAASGSSVLGMTENSLTPSPHSSTPSGTGESAVRATSIRHWNNCDTKCQGIDHEELCTCGAYHRWRGDLETEGWRKLPSAQEKDGKLYATGLSWVFVGTVPSSPSQPAQEEGGALRECPFCGGNARLYKRELREAQGDAVVECENAACSAAVFREFDKEAIAAWNRRAAPAPAGDESLLRQLSLDHGSDEFCSLPWTGESGLFQRAARELTRLTAELESLRRPLPADAEALCAEMLANPTATAMRVRAEIERLTAEIERLGRERDEARTAVLANVDLIAELNRRLLSAEAGEAGGRT